MKQTAVELKENILQIFATEKELSIINKAKEMEEQQKGYSEEDLKYAFDSGRVRLTFDKKRPFVFKNYEEFI